MRVTIYHGYEEDGRMVFGIGNDDQTPALIVNAYTYETDAEGTDPSVIYRQNNAVFGTEYNVLNQARSLSVGDIIAIADPEGGTTWQLVASVGFMRITAAEFDDITETTMADIRSRIDALNAEYAARRNS